MDNDVIAHEVRETDDVYRIYRPEWIYVYTAAATFSSTASDAHTVTEQVKEHFETRYRGRVRDDDWAIECVGEGETFMARLLLRLPNLKGEFKHAFLAQRHADSEGWADYTIVQRNSRADHELRSYSVRRLAE